MGEGRGPHEEGSAAVRTSRSVPNNFIGPRDQRYALILACVQSMQDTVEEVLAAARPAADLQGAEAGLPACTSGG